MSRTSIVVWLLAVSCMESSAAEPVQYMNVTVGQNVMLPCPCSEDTNKLVWQIGEEIVVNHCCEQKDPKDKSYEHRTQVFMSSTKGNCSLLLRNVSLNDNKIFTCYTFNGRPTPDIHEVGLRVEVGPNEGAVNQSQKSSNNPSNLEKEPQTGFLVGIPLSLILVILAGLIVILVRKHWQRRPRMIVIQDPQAKLPIMNHTPV